MYKTQYLVYMYVCVFVWWYLCISFYTCICAYARVWPVVLLFCSLSPTPNGALGHRTFGLLLLCYVDCWCFPLLFLCIFPFALCMYVCWFSRFFLLLLLLLLLCKFFVATYMYAAEIPHSHTAGISSHFCWVSSDSLN